MDEQRYTNEYRTGRTHPQKSRSGLIAFLLICVIFLCGMVSVLGLMNIRLFRQLQETNTEVPLSFAQGDLTPVEPEGDSLTVGGITVQEMPAMYSEVYDLPAGLYVIDAPEGSPVMPGDVLVGFDRSAVGSLAELNALLLNRKAGETPTLSLYRQDADYFTHTVTLD